MSTSSVALSTDHLNTAISATWAPIWCLILLAARGNRVCSSVGKKDVHEGSYITAVWERS